MDAYSRRVIGWSIDARQDTDLVVNALAMAVARRNPDTRSTILHSDQYTSWALESGCETRACSDPWERWATSTTMR
ncbi:DDE-type integrase/transposase/recombinase [Nonomuraea sp. SBT364]|uniref:DDE-type integrase/transposase/recombinase n=1 Tax=Nonomuraea sp. SBT364 TaxID=1580530 RepID=UPI0012E2689B